MKEKMWAYMLELSTNMWGDPGSTGWIAKSSPFYDTFATDEETWDKVVDFLPAQGINTVLVDVGDGYVCESHPEINIPGAWSKNKLKDKLDHIRCLGMTPIPKLNFSARHDAWLKDYSHMLATPIYRKVCCDLMDEVCELFDGPEFFHLGFDEERWEMLRYQSFTAVRSGDLWWNDFYCITGQAEKNGARPWVWTDLTRHDPKEYFSKMPKSVLLSNFYYDFWEKLPNGRYDNDRVNAYLDLDAAGYDQVPSCSSCTKTYNDEETVKLGREELDQDRLAGFLVAPWLCTFRENYYALLSEAWRFGLAKGKYYPEDK